MKANPNTLGMQSALHTYTSSFAAHRLLGRPWVSIGPQPPFRDDFDTNQVHRVQIDAQFQQVYEEEFGYVLNSLRRLGVREGDLEDVAHDLFLAVYRRWDDRDPARPIRPWLFGFAVRMAADYRRLARLRYEQSDDAPVEHIDSGLSPEGDLEQSRKRSLVLKALDALDLDKRAVLVMHELDGVSIPDVAVALSIPLNTAYSRLRLARRDFEKAVSELNAPNSAERLLLAEEQA